MQSVKAQKYFWQKCKTKKYKICKPKSTIGKISQMNLQQPKHKKKQKSKYAIEKKRKNAIHPVDCFSFASEVWRKVLHGQEGGIFNQIFVCIKNFIQISNRIFSDKNMHSYHIRIIYLIQIYLDILLYSFFISTFIFNTNIFEYSFVYFFICILIFQYKYI